MTTLMFASSPSIISPTSFVESNPPMLTDEQTYQPLKQNKSYHQYNAHHSQNTTLNNYDVICGRGQLPQRHVGNKRFQVIVDMHKEKYANARSKDDKTRISLSIMSLLASSGGRFLKLDTTTHQYHEVREDKAREKVTDALRQAVQSGGSSIFREFAKKQEDGAATDKKKRKRTMAATNDNEPNKTVAKLLIAQHELYRKLLSDFGLSKDGCGDDDDDEEDDDQGDTSGSASDNDDDEISSLSGCDDDEGASSESESSRRKRRRSCRKNRK